MEDEIVRSQLFFFLSRCNIAWSVWHVFFIILLKNKSILLYQDNNDFMNELSLVGKRHLFHIKVAQENLEH